MIKPNESHLYNALFQASIVLTKINHLPFGLFIFKIMYNDF